MAKEAISQVVDACGPASGLCRAYIRAGCGLQTPGWRFADPSWKRQGIAAQVPELPMAQALQ
jgi:hypothetical protein